MDNTMHRGQPRTGGHAPRNDSALTGGEPGKAQVESEAREPAHSTDAAPEVHPACLLLPDMTAEDFDGLKADIGDHGLLHPILLFEGRILDGRHRARACAELGIVARFEQWTGADPVAFVLSENLHRRHLTASQRAMIAAQVMAAHKAAAQARQKAGITLASREANPPLPGKATATAAAAVGVSRASVERAVKVTQEGTPEDVREVLDGKMTVNAKAREVGARERQPGAGSDLPGTDRDLTRATTPQRGAPAGPPKPTPVQAMQCVIGVTAALAKLDQVAAALDRDDARRLVAQLEAALARYRPMLAEQGADHA